MARRENLPQLEPAPYVKSPYQLEQWASYEALTAQREHERQAAIEASEAAKGLFDEYEKWRQADLIREYVAKTMSLLPADTSPAAVAAARG